MIDLPAPDLPRWLIDDTAGIGDARIFVIHTQEPRFVAEHFPDGEADVSNFVISVADGDLVVLQWLGEPPDPREIDATELIKSFNAAMDLHAAVRWEETQEE